MSVFHLLVPSEYLNDQEKYNERILACNKCDWLTNLRTCGNKITHGCGCLIDQKAKLTREECPRGKWKAIK